MSTGLESLLGLDVVIEENVSSEDMRLLFSMMYPDKIDIIDDELIVGVVNTALVHIYDFISIY
jgi:hypothetical protein